MTRWESYAIMTNLNGLLGVTTVPYNTSKVVWDYNPITHGIRVVIYGLHDVSFTGQRQILYLINSLLVSPYT